MLNREPLYNKLNFIQAPKSEPKKKTQEGPLVAGCGTSHWSLVRRCDSSEIWEHVGSVQFYSTEPALLHFHPTAPGSRVRGGRSGPSLQIILKSLEFTADCAAQRTVMARGRPPVVALRGRLFGHKQIRVCYLQCSSCTGHKVNCG